MLSDKEKHHVLTEAEAKKYFWAAVPHKVGALLTLFAWWPIAYWITNSNAHNSYQLLAIALSVCCAWLWHRNTANPADVEELNANRIAYMNKLLADLPEERKLLASAVEVGKVLRERDLTFVEAQHGEHKKMIALNALTQL